MVIKKTTGIHFHWFAVLVIAALSLAVVPRVPRVVVWAVAAVPAPRRRCERR